MSSSNNQDSYGIPSGQPISSGSVASGFSSNSLSYSAQAGDTYGTPSGSPVSNSFASTNIASQDSYGVSQAQPLALNPRANTLQDVTGNGIDASSASSGYRIERDSKALEQEGDAPTAAAADTVAVIPEEDDSHQNEVDSSLESEEEEDERLLERLIAEAAAVAAPVSNLVQDKS